MYYYYFNLAHECDDPKYSYIWIPSQCSFRLFDEAVEDKIPNSDKFLIGSTRNDFIVEKYLGEPMVFTSPIAAATWISKQRLTQLPLYRYKPILGREKINYAYANGGTVNIEDDSFPINGPTEYNFTKDTDPIILTFLDSNGKRLPSTEYHKICNSPAEAMSVIEDWQSRDSL